MPYVRNWISDALMNCAILALCNGEDQKVRMEGKAKDLSCHLKTWAPSTKGHEPVCRLLPLSVRGNTRG